MLRVALSETVRFVGCTAGAALVVGLYLLVPLMLVPLMLVLSGFIVDRRIQFYAAVGVLAVLEVLVIWILLRTKAQIEPWTDMR